MRRVERETSEKSRKFISGVYVLTLSTVIVKIIGLIYKIPMLKLLGNVGMGYFNCAYELYASFCVISTSGMPVAMSLLVSGTSDERKRKRIFKVALLTFFVIGILCMSVILGLAYPFSVFLGSPDTYVSLLCISPAIFFICLSSAVRGYFQGLGQMHQTAISQVIEAMGKLAFGLFFANISVKLGMELKYVVAMAVLGLTVAEMLSAAYLFASKGKALPCDDNSKKDMKVFGTLMRTAIPITLSASVLSITKVVDMSMIFRRLGSLGYNSDLVNTIYGSYTTLAIPLFGLAPALVSAIALPLIPAISSAHAEGNTDMQDQISRRAFKLTSLVSAPIGAGLVIFSRPILELIFYGENEAISYAAPMLTVLGLSVLLSCTVTVQNALLQAYHKPNLPIISMLCGSAVKIVICYWLVGNENINAFGIPIGTFICDATISTINFAFLAKHSPLKFNFADFLMKPYFCAIFACITSYLAVRAIAIPNSGVLFDVMIKIGVTAALYVILLFITRTLNKNEIEILLLKKHNI